MPMPSSMASAAPGAMPAMRAMPAMLPLPPADGKADPDMKRVLDALNGFNAPPLPSVIPRIARELPSFADALQATLSAMGKPCVEPVAKIVHKVIDGPGGPLLLRVYTPAGTGPFPVIVYFHGGGWVIANLDTYDASPRQLANGAGAVVVSVAYRQAPENPFPAAPMDAFAAYKWVLANAATIDGDPKRVAVAGESAGGNLAAVTSQQARDAGIQIPVHQLLVYPVANFATDTASYAQYTKAVPLDKPAVLWFGKYYLRTPADAANPLASPLRAKSFAGLPPATIINAEIDPLRDDGALYAAKLKAAGVPVTRTLYSGVSHEFFGMGAAVDKARQAMAQATDPLKARFAAKM
jgi:acetyl esterase